MTSSLKKATPFHVFVLATLVAASGGFIHLNKNRISTAPRNAQVVVQVAPENSGTQEKAVVVAAADPVAQVSEEAAQPAQPQSRNPAPKSGLRRSPGGISGKTPGSGF